MKRILLILLVVLLTTLPALAGKFAKPYYAGTKPGTWAKLSLTTAQGYLSKYTYTCLAGPGGSVLVELLVSVSSGPGEGTTSRTLYVVEPGFDFAMDGLSFATAITGMVSQYNDNPVTVTSGDIIRTIRTSCIDYRDSADFVGRQTIDGRNCDHYTFEAHSAGPHPMTQQGEMWLDPGVPFATVRQRAKVMDKSGKVLSDTDMRLVDFGDGATGTPALLAALPRLGESAPSGSNALPAIREMALGPAYEKEQIRLNVAVQEGTQGRKLEVTVTNKSDQPLKLKLPAGTTRFKAGAPLNTLTIHVDQGKIIELSPRQSAPPVAVDQAAGRGAVAGAFDLSIYEGEPLFTGTVTMGKVGQ